MGEVVKLPVPVPVKTGRVLQSNLRQVEELQLAMGQLFSVMGILETRFVAVPVGSPEGELCHEAATRISEIVTTIANACDQLIVKDTPRTVCKSEVEVQRAIALLQAIHGAEHMFYYPVPCGDGCYEIRAYRFAGYV